MAELTTKVVVNDYFLVEENDILLLLDGGTNMTNLKKNIDHYMELKGIKMYSHLLHEIALKLDFKGQAAYDFVNREKANFSKTLKGERPLKYEYIIPLEKIFGVSLARMTEENSYKLPVDKEMVPFVKGFRYYAYLDDISLYENELTKLLSKEGKSILHGMDEFGKTFLDYVVEYNSVNGVRFLHDYYKIKLRHWNNQFETEPKGVFWIHETGVEFCRLVANIGDLALFNDIYDSYYMFASHCFRVSCLIYNQDDYFEIVMDHDYLFNDLFEIKTYEYELGHTAKRKQGRDYMSFSSINPVINGCLNYALKHLDKYKSRAIEILKFGIEHNKRVKEGLDIRPEDIYIDEVGGLRNIKNDDVVDIAVEVSVKDITDKAINELISQLPKFNEPVWRR